MARNNKTEFAVLGLLCLDPMSGYDMKTFISESIGYFWQESYGQIYPTLRTLLRENLVSRKVESGPGRPDRHVYYITDAGRKKFTDWLAAETDPEPVRNELLLKIFFGQFADPQHYIKHLENLKAHQERKLKTYTSIRKAKSKEFAGDSFLPFGIATLRFGEHMAQARIRWCKETLAALRRFKKEVE